MSARRPDLVASAHLAEEAARVAEFERQGLADAAKACPKGSSLQDQYRRLAMLAERRAKHHREIAAAYRAIAENKEPTWSK